jgi:hypothetical protein
VICGASERESNSHALFRELGFQAPFLNFGVDVQFSAHWSIRTDLRGRYVEPDFVEPSRSRASFSVLPVFRF